MLRTQRGQSLIEYVILVALIGIASIVAVGHLNRTVTLALGNIINRLGTKKVARLETREFTYKDAESPDFTSFMRGFDEENAEAAERKSGP